MSDNLRIYNAARSVPPEALTPITGGRLKGMTDVKPMWRIKKLTELYGPCGIGWTYTTPVYQFIPGAKGEIVCMASTEVAVKEGDDWSLPIPGVGGSMLVVMEKNGLYTDDEAPKKALTDAISVACKALGFAADVYFAKDKTKYNAPPEEAPAPPADPLALPSQIARLKSIASPKQLAYFQSKYNLDADFSGATSKLVQSMIDAVERKKKK